MIEINVWADVRCPWCWIGLRRLQRAGALIDEPVSVCRRSFLLEPDGPKRPGSVTSHVAVSEWGMSTALWAARSRFIRSEGRTEGLRIEIDTTLIFDSNPLHRLLKQAAKAGIRDAKTAWEEAFSAHFERNENLGDPAVLHDLGARWGLSYAEVEGALAGNQYADEVAEDVEEARRLSVTSVPTVVDSHGRRLSGNVSVDELVQFLVADRHVR